MVKIEPSLFNKVWGSAGGKTFKTYEDKRKIIMTHKKPVPSYTRTAAQDQQRNKFENAVAQWNALTEAEKQQYRQLGAQEKPPLTGYQYFIKQKLLEAEIWYKVTIDNTSNSNTLTDYQILIEINNDTQFFNDAQNKREAIRLYDNDKATQLSYWIEEWDDVNNNAKIWVKVPSIPASSTKTIYISVDPSRTTDESNGDNTFIFFDDFDGTSLDPSKWNDDGFAGYGGLAGYYSVHDSLLEYWSTPSVWRILKANSQISQDKIVEWKMKTPSAAGSANWWAIIDDDGSERIAAVDASADGDIDFRFRHAGTYTDELDKLTWQTETWYIVTNIKIGTTKGKCKINDIESTIYDYTSWNTTMYPVLWAEDTYHWFLDWIRIRKYTDPEPNISYIKE